MTEFEGTLNDVLVDTFNCILKYEENSLKAISSTSVTVVEAHIIEVIGQGNEEMTVSEIAACLDIATPTATVAIKRLERKGLVLKLPCISDGRRWLVQLTELGKKIDRAHRIFHRRMVRNISGSFSNAEKEVLLSALKKLKKFFQEEVEA